MSLPEQEKQVSSLHTHTRGRIWTLPFIMTTMVSFLVSNVNQMTIPILPVYITHLGGTPSELGLVLGVFPLAAMVARPFAGMLTDRYGRRLVMLGGAFLFLLGLLPMGFVANTTMMILCRIVQGLGFSGLSTATGTLAADLLPRERLGEGIGYFGLSMTLGMAIGPIVGQALVEGFGYPVLFLAASALMLLSLPLSALIRQRETVRRDRKTNFPSDFIEPAAFPSAIVMLFLAIPLAGIFSFIPAHALERGIPNSGLFYTIYALSILAIRVFAGKLPDKIGSNKTMLVSIGPIIVGLILIGTAANLPVLLFAALIYGAAYGLVFPMLNAEALGSTSTERRGSASATFSLSLDIGIAVGSFFWSGVIGWFSHSAIFFGSIFFVSVAVIVHTVLNKTARKPRSSLAG